MEGIDWGKLIEQGPVLALVALFLLFLWRTLPSLLSTWQTIKLADAQARKEQAAAFVELSGTLKEVCIEQRRATDAVRLQSRVNADSTDSLVESVDGLRDDVAKLNRRIDKIEGKQ